MGRKRSSGVMSGALTGTGSLWDEVVREGFLEVVGLQDESGFSQAEGIKGRKSQVDVAYPLGPVELRPV